MNRLLALAAAVALSGAAVAAVTDGPPRIAGAVSPELRVETPSNCGTTLADRMIYGQCLAGTGQYYVYAKAVPSGQTCLPWRTMTRFNGNLASVPGLSTGTVAYGYRVCSLGLWRTP